LPLSSALYQVTSINHQKKQFCSTLEKQSLQTVSNHRLFLGSYFFGLAVALASYLSALFSPSSISFSNSLSSTWQVFSSSTSTSC
jgi:hypothetical protein